MTGFLLLDERPAYFGDRLGANLTTGRERLPFI
jgi:hypothetical protein